MLSSQQPGTGKVTHSLEENMTGGGPVGIQVGEGPGTVTRDSIYENHEK